MSSWYTYLSLMVACVSSRCPYTVKGGHEPNITLKDNDLKYKIRLPNNVAINVLYQLKKDSEFLYSIGVMDFSLLGSCS
jgi:hypothetical protein